MSFNRNILGENSKEEILELVENIEFKNIFLKYNIENIILFGSITNNEFNEESDIDIAIIGEKKITAKLELQLNLELEKYLQRTVDIIDINDDEIENFIKISALNSEKIISKTKIYEETFDKYDKLFKENIEFWNRLDRVVLDYE